MTRIVPVLDVMNGVAVRAVGGRREEYQPLRSKLVDSTDPATVAAAMLAATGAKELYLADLDAIDRLSAGFSSSPPWLCREGWGEGSSAEPVPTLPPPLPAKPGRGERMKLHARQSRNGVPALALPANNITIWLDAGWRTTRVQLPSNVVPVFSLESLAPLSLEPWPAGAIFSIDLKAGILNGDWRAWKLKHDRDAIGLATTLHANGVRRMIVLDVAAVGEGRGVPTLDVCREIREAFPDVEIITGGGVRTLADVQMECADAVLVASAIHEGIPFRVPCPRLCVSM